MKIDLTETTASKVNKALVQGRRTIGTPAIGMVLTLVIVTDEENAYDALKAANEASREHPSRTLVVIKRVSRSPRDRAKARLDAEVRVGADAGTGETVVLRLYGEAINHAQSVVLPLLLPDAPVVVWWPVNAPVDAARDPLGALAQRRVTDMYTAENPLRELAERAEAYSPATRTCPGPASPPGAPCWRRHSTSCRARCPRSRSRARSSTPASSCSPCGSPTG